MKKARKRDSVDDLILDDEEKRLELAFEKRKYKESKDLMATRKMLEEAAKRYQELNISRPITIRINQLDLIKLKAKAKSKNIPYQTLLGVLIRDYNEGKRDLRL